MPMNDYSITYFYRNIKAGYSINKAFKTITSHINPKVEYEVPFYRANLRSIIGNLIFVWNHRNTRGINHITGDIHYCILALIGCKSVLTIHDTSAYDHAKSLLKKKIIYYLWFRVPLFLADRVVCISENTKKEILKFTNRKDIEVIYNPIDPIFREKFKLFDDECPNILLIGTAWNKNIERTLEAISSIKCKVTIIGNLTNEIKQIISNYKISYIHKVDLTDEDIYNEYCNSDIVSFCSLYEGFGMPIIEANKVGRVIITSNLEPLREVAANAGYFVDPLSKFSITQGFQIICSNSELRMKLIEYGKINSLRFSPINIVAKYKHIYMTLKGHI